MGIPMNAWVRTQRRSSCQSIPVSVLLGSAWSVDSFGAVAPSVVISPLTSPNPGLASWKGPNICLSVVSVALGRGSNGSLVPSMTLRDSEWRREVPRLYMRCSCS